VNDKFVIITELLRTEARGGTTGDYEKLSIILERHKLSWKKKHLILLELSQTENGI